MDALLILDHFIVGEKKFLAEVRAVFVEGNFRNELPHVVQHDVLVVGMQVAVERPKRKPEVNLLLDYLKLVLVSLGSHLTEVLRHLCLAHCDNALVLVQSTKRDLHEALIPSDAQNQVVVVKLSL